MPASYVPSLDGLRTVAVGLVIAFHLSTPYLGLGFAGVDIFFVLSGYLITSGLLRDVEEHGRPRFASFWQRRFKRLLPAATLALVVVLAYATFLMPLYRRDGASWDVFWTTLYLGNWHFMGANTYFAADGNPSLLLHMWSLAVEEQFYFAWPLLIGLVAWLTAKGRRRAVLAAVTAALIVASALLLVLLFNPEAPDRAYMGTDTKAFEPLLGALLAIGFTRPGVRDFFGRHRRALAAVGVVAGMAVLPFLAGPSAFYFRGGALVLSLAVAALIGALIVGPEMAVARALAWRPMAYLGQISYGLYIWHWPWSVWLGVAHNAQFQPLRAAAALAGTIVTSVLSFHLVEEPVRRGRLGRWFTPRRVAVAVPVVMAVLLAWASVVRLMPPADLGRTTIVVTGDSVPFKLMGNLDRVGTERGVIVDNAARGGCTPLAIEMQEYRKPDHQGAGDCRALRAIQDARIERDDPDIVVWWSRYESHQRWLDGRLVGPEEEQFWTALDADLAATVDRLTRDGAILVIAQPERPGPELLNKCHVGDPDCHPLDDNALNHDEYRRRWNQVVQDLVARDDRVRTFRMDPIFCSDPEPAEPASPSACDDLQPDGEPLRYDGVHVTLDRYGDQIAGEVLDAVLAAAGKS